MNVAAGGFLVWGLITVASAWGTTSLGVIELLFLLAPLVLVPLGVGLAQGDGPVSTPPGRLARWLLPIGAVMAATSFWPAPGPTAAWWAAGWGLVCALLAIDGLWRLARRGYRSAEGLCLGLGFLYLFVGAAWLVLSRRGVAPFQFPARTVLLAAVHFHFTGFALPMVVLATAGALRARGGPAPTSLLRLIVAGTLLGPALLAAGNIRQAPPLKLAGALLLALASMGLASVMTSLLGSIWSRLARTLLAVSALSLVLGMTLVVVHAVGEYLAADWLQVPQMARLHGTMNALGFAACGLVGWSLARRPRGPG